MQHANRVGIRSCRRAASAWFLLALAAAVPTAALVALIIRRRRDDLKVVVIKARGIEVHVSPFGATVTRVVVPDATGAPGDVVLGYDRLASYDDPSDRPYLGAIVGRVANRIAGARFTLDGETHALCANNGPNCLHGGSKGFDRAWWTVDEVFEDGTGVRLTHVSEDGDEGFPGRVTIAVTYAVRDNGGSTRDVGSTGDDDRDPSTTVRRDAGDDDGRVDESNHAGEPGAALVL